MTTDQLHDRMEYFRVFDRHEALRWRLNADVPWARFQPGAVSEDEKTAVHTAALSEFTTVAAAHNFLGEFQDDLDFSCWVSVWFYEEVKHHYALRRWLSLCGVDVPAREIATRARPNPPGATRAGTCTLNVISELRAARWYTDMSRQTREPVLAVLLKNIAADESRHAVVFADFAKRHIAADRARNLRAVLATAYFWLADPANAHHPADHFYPNAAADLRIDRLPLAHQGLALVNAKIFTFLSDMTGHALESCRDIKRALRPLPSRANAVA